MCDVPSHEPDPEPDTLMRDALDHHRHGRHQAALDALTRGFGPDPDAWEPWSLRGLCLSDLGRHAEALQAFRRSTALKPNYPDFYNAGNALLALDDPEAALAEFERSIECDDGYAQAWVNRGIALTRLGRTGPARASFDRAIAVDRALPQAWRCRAVLRQGEGDQDGAVGDYLRVTELVPDSAVAWLELGDELARLPADRHLDTRPDGRLWRAVAAYGRAIGLAPEDPAAWAGQAIVLGRLAHAAQASERLSAVAGVPGPVRFATVYARWLDHLDAAVAQFPDDDWFAECRADARDLVS